MVGEHLPAPTSTSSWTDTRPWDDAFIAAGFSGHGYKFCSVIGRVMADFCLGEEGKGGWRGSGWGRGGGRCWSRT